MNSFDLNIDHRCFYELPAHFIFIFTGFSPFTHVDDPMMTSCLDLSKTQSILFSLLWCSFEVDVSSSDLTIDSASCCIFSDFFGINVQLIIDVVPSLSSISWLNDLLEPLELIFRLDTTLTIIYVVFPHHDMMTSIYVWIWWNHSTFSFSTRSSFRLLSLLVSVFIALPPPSHMSSRVVPRAASQSRSRSPSPDGNIEDMQQVDTHLDDNTDRNESTPQPPPRLLTLATVQMIALQVGLHEQATESDMNKLTTAVLAHTRYTASTCCVMTSWRNANKHSFRHHHHHHHHHRHSRHDDHHDHHHRHVVVDLDRVLDRDHDHILVLIVIPDDTLDRLHQTPTTIIIVIDDQAVDHILVIVEHDHHHHSHCYLSQMC